MGEFVWSDSRGFIFNPATIAGGWPNATNTFNVRATGGVWFISGINGVGAPATACAMQPGVGTWNCSSSRDTKTDFNRTDVRDVLDKVVALPIATWRFKGEDANVRHMGPMAQDFRAAFGLGHDDTTISSVDAPGVALAAIQGLNAKLEAERTAKDAEIAALRAELADLRSLRSEVASIRAAQSSR